MKFARVVVGVDGGAGGDAASRWAAKAVRETNGEVVAVHGLGTTPEVLGEAALDAVRGLGFSRSGDPGSKDDVRQVVEELWCRPLREAGVRYRTRVSDLDPVEALLTAARDEDADVIVIGHHGDAGHLNRLFQGLGDQLVDHARRPVVVVPAPT